DFVFLDPPYSTHLKYSGLPECIGELDAHDERYYEAMDLVFGELDRVLKRERYLALYVGDSHDPVRGFASIGMRLFALLSKRFSPVEHIAVVRHHKTLERRSFHDA